MAVSNPKPLNELDILIREILITPLVGAMVERGIRPPSQPTKCECVTEYAMNGNPDRIVEWADKDCPLCDGDGIQKRDTPTFCKCGDERCEHGGCENEHCRYFCTRCQKAREAEKEATYQSDVAGPLCDFDKESAQ